MVKVCTSFPTFPHLSPVSPLDLGMNFHGHRWGVEAATDDVWSPDEVVSWAPVVDRGTAPGVFPGTANAGREIMEYPTVKLG